MAVRISKTERRRAERRGYRKFIELEEERLERGVYADEEAENAEKTIEDCEERIAEIDSDVGEDDEDRILDDVRYPEDTEDEYESDEEAHAEGFGSKEEGNEHWNDARDEMWEQSNLPARVECTVAEDLASEGIAMKDIVGVIEDFEDVQEELWKEFGVTDGEEESEEEDEK